jgi:hypothetical protein
MIRAHSNCEKCKTLGSERKHAAKAKQAKNKVYGSANPETLNHVDRQLIHVELDKVFLVEPPELGELQGSSDVLLMHSDGHMHDQLQQLEPLGMRNDEPTIYSVLKGFEKIQASVQEVENDIESVASSMRSMRSIKDQMVNLKSNRNPFQFNDISARATCLMDEILKNHMLLSRSYLGLQKQNYLASCQDLVDLSLDFYTAVKSTVHPHKLRDDDLQQALDQLQSLTVVCKCIKRQKSADAFDVDSERQLVSICQSLLNAHLNLASLVEVKSLLH